MQSLKNCEMILDIWHITNIMGGDQAFEVTFLNEAKEECKLVFERGVWDMRYSIENASIDRFCKFRECLPMGLIDNSLYVVEDSEYIKYFEQQVCGTRPDGELKHYLLIDKIDTTLDILSWKDPIVVKSTSTNS